MGQVETGYIFREALLTFIFFLQIMIVIRAVLSWLPSNVTNSLFGDIILKITDPILSIIYKVTNNRLVMERVDFTPLIAYFLLGILRTLILRMY